MRMRKMKNRDSRMERCGELPRAITNSREVMIQYRISSSHIFDNE